MVSQRNHPLKKQTTNAEPEVNDRHKHCSCQGTGVTRHHEAVYHEGEGTRIYFVLDKVAIDCSSSGEESGLSAMTNDSSSSPDVASPVTALDQSDMLLHEPLLTGQSSAMQLIHPFRKGTLEYSTELPTHFGKTGISLRQTDCKA